MLQLLVNAEVYSPSPIGRQHLLVGAEKILWVGAEEPRLPAELSGGRIDLNGARVIPGFIDGHTHLTGGGGEAGFSSQVPRVPVDKFTSAGVTTVVGLLGTDDITRSTASLLARTRALREEGISAYCHTGGYHLPATTLIGNVGEDIVHLDPVIGMGELAISDHRSSQPTLAELLRVASEVHVAGMITGKAGILHLHLGDGVRGLALVREALDTAEIPARVYNPTHVNRRARLFEEALKVAERGCTIDVTAFPTRETADELAAAHALERYFAAGLPPERITVSSDSGGCLPAFNEHGEMLRMGIGSADTLGATLRELIAGGMELGRALPPFTSNVARLLRLPAKGRIGPGADADLVVLDEAGEIRDVMAMGRWHRRDYEQLRSGYFTAQPS